MSMMISDKDIVRVHLSLEVSQTVAEMLERRVAIDDDEAYALMAVLSEMTSEKCLLASACVARFLSRERFIDEALKVSLSLQADAAFDDYAPRYLAGLRQSMKPTCDGYALYMQEDLESFSELFSMTSDLPGGSVALHDIATIFADQTAAHAEALDIEGDLFDYDAVDLLRPAPNILLFSLAGKKAV